MRALLVLAAACSAAKAPSTVVDATASSDAIRADFDAHAGEARFLTLLSPT
jgi:hypothetical protein